MSRDGSERILDDEQIEEMVGLIRPDWRVREATLSSSGWTTLYRLVVETDEGRTPAIVKAAPDIDQPTGIDAEARTQAIVRAQTEIPVPATVGVVDDHETLRTPFFLMESVPGETIPMAEVGNLPNEFLQCIAHETGRYLGELHDINIEFDSFGKGVDYDGPTLVGDRPSGDPSQLVVRDGYENWKAQLREWFEEDLELLADSRFVDLEPDLEMELEARLTALPDDFEPVLGRVDHGWFNFLVDCDETTIRGVIDWGSRFAVPPAFDLAVVEYLLAGGWWIIVPDVPDRRLLVREALLGGYREVREVPPMLPVERACYQLDDLLRSAAVLEDRSGGSDRAIPPDRIEEAADGYRTALEAELARKPNR